MMTFDADEVRAGCDALDGDGGAVVVPCEVVAVVGPDAGRYLQGQCSQELVAMAGPSAWTFVLAPTGRVDAWVRVHRVDDEHYLLETTTGSGDALVARLRRFLLRTDATVHEPDAWTVVHRRWRPTLVRVGDVDGLVAPAIAPGDAGVDVLVAPGGSADDGDLPSVPFASMERHRIAHAMPRLGAEIDETTIPAELGQWVIDASVSFTKGCYTGQELVARIDSRGGQVPRPVRLLALDGDVAIGSVVRGADGEERGSISSAAPSLGGDRGALALAPLGRAVVIGERVVVATATGEVGGTVVEPGSVR